MQSRPRRPFKCNVVDSCHYEKNVSTVRINSHNKSSIIEKNTIDDVENPGTVLGDRHINVAVLHKKKQRRMNTNIDNRKPWRTKIQGF